MIKAEYLTADGGHMIADEETKKIISTHTDVVDLLEEAIGLVQLPEYPIHRLKITVDIGRIVGRDGCVNTTLISPETETLFAWRQHRPGPSRVIQTVGNETTKITIKAAGTENPHVYRLLSAYIGEPAIEEPWHTKIQPGSTEERQSLNFWCSHALVWDQRTMGEPFVDTWIRVLSNLRKKDEQ